MRLTRHAKNRIRFVARTTPAVTHGSVLEALLTGKTVGYDSRGNRRVSVEIAGAILMVVVDDAHRVVVTMWKES